MTDPSEETQQLILPLLKRACERAASLNEEDKIPATLMPGLRRISDELEVVELETVDWRALMGTLLQTDGFLEAILGSIGPLKDDDVIEGTIGWDSDPRIRANTLWNSVLSPILKAYWLGLESWDWRPPLAGERLRSWYRSHGHSGRRRQCLAPLHNCKGIVDEVDIEPGLSIRRFRDEERDDLWQRHGAERFPGPINPTVSQLERWDYVIDYRWRLEPPVPLNEGIAIETARNVVRALRLHHPGVTGISVLWLKEDPADLWSGDRMDSLYAPIGVDPSAFEHRLEMQLGSVSGESMKPLLDAVRRADSDKRLSLSLDRFDSAYGRRQPADRLIDLWIAFEALVLPENQGELSYRAAIRLAQLVGADVEEKKAAFDLARSSYKRRSDVVHGSPKTKAEELAITVEDTRELARKALRTWLIDRPANGVETLDHAIFQRESSAEGVDRE